MRLFKQILMSIVLFISITAFAIAAYPDVQILLNSAKTTGSYKAVQFDKKSPTRISQIVLTGESAVSAVVTLDASLNGTNWTTLGTFNIASSPVASQVSYLAITSPWSALRGTITGITSISGAAATSSAAVTLMVAE